MKVLSSVIAFTAVSATGFLIVAATTLAKMALAADPVQAPVQRLVSAGQPDADVAPTVLPLMVDKLLCNTTMIRCCLTTTR